jgi:lysozyme
MNRPQMTLEQVQEIIKYAPDTIQQNIHQLVANNVISQKEYDDYIMKFAKVPTEAIIVVAIRGYFKDSMGKPGQNDRGIYDDAMFVIAPNYFQSFNANTDPSKYQPGIAKLMPGLHYYKKGLHKISGPHPYPAFRPDTPDEGLPVTRDGQTGIKRGIAINLHRGGEFNTSSEGCQTILYDEWDEFQTTLYKMLDNESQHILPYLLIEQ